MHISLHGICFCSALHISSRVRLLKPCPGKSFRSSQVQLLTLQPRWPSFAKRTASRITPGHLSRMPGALEVPRAVEVPALDIELVLLRRMSVESSRSSRDVCCRCVAAVLPPKNPRLPDLLTTSLTKFWLQGRYARSARSFWGGSSSDDLPLAPSRFPSEVGFLRDFSRLLSVCKPGRRDVPQSIEYPNTCGSGTSMFHRLRSWM